MGTDLARRRRAGNRKQLLEGPLTCWKSARPGAASPASPRLTCEGLAGLGSAGHEDRSLEGQHPPCEQALLAPAGDIIITQRMHCSAQPGEAVGLLVALPVAHRDSPGDGLLPGGVSLHPSDAGPGAPQTSGTRPQVAVWGRRRAPIGQLLSAPCDILTICDNVNDPASKLEGGNTGADLSPLGCLHSAEEGPTGVAAVIDRDPPARTPPARA